MGKILKDEIVLGNLINPKKIDGASEICEVTANFEDESEVEEFDLNEQFKSKFDFVSTADY